MAGKGRRTILAPMALYLESSLLNALARNHRVVMYDPRNRGRSDAAPLDRVSIDYQIEDAEAIRRHLGLGKVAVLGWSGPGMEMARYALRYPDSVLHLILLSPVAPSSDFRSGRTPAVDRVTESALAALDSEADAGAFANRDRDYCSRRARLSALADLGDDSLIDSVPDACAHANEWPANLWPYFGKLLGTFGQFDLRDQLAASGKPVLVIHGTADRVPFEGGEAWVSCNPNGLFLPLAGVGHFTFIERRDQVVIAIGDHLKGRTPREAFRPYCPGVAPEAPITSQWLMTIPNAWFPRWSRDGRWLYFARNEGSSWEIGRVAPPAGDFQPLVRMPGRTAHPDPSPDNRRIAFQSDGTGDGNTHLFVTDIRLSEKPRQLTDLKGFAGVPAWSPRGDWIAFQWRPSNDFDDDTKWRIGLIRPDGSGLHWITPGEYNDQVPQWTRDGGSIYFFSDQTGRNQLMAMNREGGERRFLWPSASTDTAPQPIDGGSCILFATDRFGGQGLALFNSRTRSVRQIFSVEGQILGPALTPDKRSIAYTIVRNGRSEIAMEVLSSGICGWNRLP
jgi:pimeloyl-ACP methyl ester carboxylesterase